VAAVAAIAALVLACASVANAASLDLSRLAPGRDAQSGTVSASSSQDAENKAKHTGSGDTNEDTRSTDQSARDASVSNDQSNDGDSGDSANAAATGDRDCSDFSTQEAAQRFFDDHGGDKHHNVDDLDRDRDGVACEDLPSESAPVGGIDTGAGGTASADAAGSSGPLPFVLAGAGLGLLLMLLGTPLRRRQGS
jgi:hypothetical protein